MSAVVEDALARGCAAFTAAASAGFPEAAHALPFPRDQGFDVDRDVQVGDVFQRAYAVQVLAALRERLGLDVAPALACEAEYLIDARRRYRPGGWSYFPDLHELPPDADDLAAVMLALIAAGRRDAVDAYCREPLRVLLEECSATPGVFDTWIVPRDGDAVHERQRWWIANAWGRGADCDVIANVVRALRALNDARHSAVVDAACDYVRGRQAEDGSWPSSWYHGPFYAGFVCARALGDAGPHVERWRAALGAAQADDGGWGWSGARDPLSTAFAVLALPVADAAAERGRAYLERAQDDDGLWPAVPWIKMELGRAEGVVRHVLSYGSRTMTSAFALDALTRVDTKGAPS